LTFASTLLFFSNTYAANSTYTEHLLEIQWAPTELNPIMLDNLMTEKYCGFNSRRFIGCLAGLERFGQTTQPRTELQLAGTEFLMVQNDSLSKMTFRQLQYALKTIECVQ
jgi:hypothetical protein